MSAAWEEAAAVGWNEEWTEWQYSSGMVEAPVSYSKIRVYVQYEYNVNEADFDGIALYREAFGERYNYNEDGTLRNVTTMAGNRDIRLYDSYGNLADYSAPGAGEDHYHRKHFGGFDDGDARKNHLLRYEDSAMWVRDVYSYDTYGNRTGHRRQDGDTTKVIYTSREYSANGDRLVKAKDPRGLEVGYTYNNNDTTSKVTMPNGQAVTYSYDAQKRVTAAQASNGNGNYKNAYVYDKDRLQKVSHNTTSDTNDVIYTFGYDAFGKAVVEDVSAIHLDQDEQDLEQYLKSLKQAALEAEKQDAFAKCRLFHETCFEVKSLDSLESLIDAVDLLLKNSEYRDNIEQYLPRKSLLELGIALREQFIREHNLGLKARYVNDMVTSIQNELQVRSSNTAVPDVDFYRILMNKEKVARFIQIVQALKRERVIEKRDLYSYQVIAKVQPYTGALEMQRTGKTKMAFSDAFGYYDHPYEFLQNLKEKENLPVADWYKYFANVKHEVLNQYGTPASGGERSEYNLLQELVDAARSDVLILDEPESSFDNLFLKDGVNTLLKDLSKKIPVIIATHNNTIGASVHPDYLIYTHKEILTDGSVKYHLYSGYPSSSELVDLDNNTMSKKSIMLDCLEAGESAYMERRSTYEILND